MLPWQRVSIAVFLLVSSILLIMINKVVYQYLHLIGTLAGYWLQHSECKSLHSYQVEFYSKTFLYNFYLFQFQFFFFVTKILHQKLDYVYHSFSFRLCEKFIDNSDVVWSDHIDVVITVRPAVGSCQKKKEKLQFSSFLQLLNALKRLEILRNPC